MLYRNTRLHLSFRLLARALVGGLIGCGLALPARAQAWQRDPVLSNIQVKRLAFDPAGFTWVGTDGGVFRYDGHELVPLDALVRQGERMPAVLISSLVADLAGKVWCATAVGLYCFEPTAGKLWRVALPQRAGEPRKVWWLWARPGTSELWVAYGKDALLVLNVHQPGQVPRQPLVRLSGNEIDWLGGAVRDHIWAVTENHGINLIGPGGRVSWSHRQSRATLLPVGVSQPQWLVSARALYEALPGGGLREQLRWLPPGVEYSFKPVVTDSTMQWIAEGRMVSLSWRAGDGRLPRVTLHSAPPRQTADITLQQGPDGLLWCYRPFERGCYKARPVGGLVRPLLPAGGGSVSTRAIRRLPDGRLLVGTYAGALTQAADSPAAPLRFWQVRRLEAGRTDGTLRPDHQPILYDLLLTRSGQVVAADEVGSVAELNPATGELRNYRLRTPPPSHGPNTYALLEDHAGRGWAGTDLGLYQLDLDRREMTRYHDADSAFTLNRLKIEQLVEAPAGMLWAATAEGLFRLQVATGQLVRYGAGESGPRRLPTSLILTVHATSPDSLWVGTRDAGLLLLHPRRGVLRQVTTRQGLPSMSVASLLTAPRTGELWVGTFAGLVRYAPRSGQMAVLTEADGLPSAELNRQSAWRDPATEMLYFGSVAGVSQLDTRQPLAPRPRPHLLLAAITQHLSAGDTVRTTLLAGTPPRGGITLGPYDAFAELTLALADYLNPEGARYAYRLLGSTDERFHPLDGTHRLRLQNLRPGSYVVEVRAETSLGLPAHNRLRVPLYVEAVWWQRPWVWSLGVVTLLGLVVGWQRRRMAQLRREHALRTRIAADLHDDVGALLSQIALQTDLLHEGLTPADQQAAQLAEVADSSRMAVRQLNDVVWSLDAHNDTLPGLLSRLRDYAHDVLHPTGRPVRFRTGEVPAVELPAEVRRHLYLIYKEALHNILKYAPAGAAVTVGLHYTADQLELTVENDGLPPEPGAPVPAGRHSGHGLRNIRERAAALRGHATTGARPEGGFAVRVSVPLR